MATTAERVHAPSSPAAKNKQGNASHPGSANGPSAGKSQQIYWIELGVLIGLLLLAYANSLQQVVRAWNSPQYEHGYLIPLIAIALIWLRRKPFSEPAAVDRWIGVGMLTFGLMMRVAASNFGFNIANYVSFVPCLLGVFMLVGGRKTMAWASLPILFLTLMFPLPDFVITSVLQYLKSLATVSSLFLLQSFGVEAYRDGNVIRLDQMEMGVIEQCSGLRMVMLFSAMAAALALILTHRPLWERIVIALSAVPIALASNVARITFAGLLYNVGGSDGVVQAISHDMAGLIMMPMGVGLLLLEMKILENIFIEVDTSEHLTIAAGGKVKPVPAR